MRRMISHQINKFLGPHSFGYIINQLIDTPLPLSSLLLGTDLIRSLSMKSVQYGTKNDFPNLFEGSVLKMVPIY